MKTVHLLVFRFSAVLTLVFASLSHQGWSENWTQWRGDNRDAKSTSTGLLQDWKSHQPRLVWMGEGLGNGYASVSIDDGRIFTTGNHLDGQAVVALDAKTGDLIWRKTLTDVPPKHGYEGSRCTPSIDGDRLYVIASSGAIICLKASDGSIQWQRDFKADWNGKMMSGWGFSESPLVDGDWVLCTPGAKDAMIVALDKMTGAEVWRTAVPDFGANEGKNGKRLKVGAGYSSIVVSNAGGVKQYVQLVGQGVIGVRASDGEFLWGYDGVANGTANIPTPIAVGDYVFCSTGYNTGSALLKLTASGKGVTVDEVYFLDSKTLQNKHGGMVLVDGHIYCGHGNGTGLPNAINLETGESPWGGPQRGAGRGEAAVVYADGNIIYRYQDGMVELVNASPESYESKGSFKPEFQEGKSWAHPVVVDGLLYLREQDKLMCYDLRQAA